MPNEVSQPKPLMDPMDAVAALSRSILYEGYSLYPYRSTAIKNTQPSLFGALYPREYCETHPEVYSEMQTECVIQDQGQAWIEVRVRFLQFWKLLVCQYSEGKYEAIDVLKFQGKDYVRTQGGIERQIKQESVVLKDLIKRTIQFPFSFESQKSEKELRNSNEKRPMGKLVREVCEISGNIQLRAQKIQGSEIEASKKLFKLSVRIENTSHVKNINTMSQKDLLGYSLNNCHTIIKAEQGKFLSLMGGGQDRGTEKFVKSCENLHTWPILVRKEDDLILSAPIILYDYPEIAPESTGDLFDSTEIEEYLLLHLSLLSEQEKKMIIEADPRLEPIVKRGEKLTQTEFMKLHGLIRQFEV